MKQNKQEQWEIDLEDKAEDLYFKHKKGCSACDGELPLRTFLDIVKSLIFQTRQEAVEEIMETSLKKVYKIILTNGSADREWILHKLSRILHGEEKL